MKIALAHDYLVQYGGAERVVAEFINLFPEAPLYTLLGSKKNLLNRPSDLIKNSFLQNIPHAEKFLKYFLGLMPLAWEQFDFTDYQIVLSSTSGLAKGIITPLNCLHICYCHTPTRYLWSDAHSYVEELKQPKIVKFFLPLLLHRLRLWDMFAAQRVDYFIANSHFVAQRIKKYYNREARVIYPPVNIDEYQISQEQDDYFIIVSRLRPYKKVDLAIKAFNELGLPLIIIGDGEEKDRLQKMAKKNIIFLGEVSEEIKKKYLARAKAFIHPQIEDFGIAAVEAMAMGKPIIAYAQGGALETVQDGVNGVYFNEQSWECLVHTILKADFAQFNPHTIRESVAKFNIARFRQEIREFIAECRQKNNQHLSL